jgi:hypothetical protein
MSPGEVLASCDLRRRLDLTGIPSENFASHDLRLRPLNQMSGPPLRGTATWQEWLRTARGRARVTWQGNPDF